MRNCKVIVSDRAERLMRVLYIWGAWLMRAVLPVNNEHVGRSLRDDD